MSGGARQAPQFGFNLSLLANDASVAYLEWSGGRSAAQLAQALQQPEARAWRNRLAAGLTYTSADKLSLTLEYEYNGAGLDRAGWDTLRRGAPADYRQYRTWLQTSQDLPTRQALFCSGTWQDALYKHLDLSAMLRFNATDHSRLSWLETRYHWNRADLALQWQTNSGRAGSEYGAAPQRRQLQALPPTSFKRSADAGTGRQGRNAAPIFLLHRTASILIMCLPRRNKSQDVPGAGVFCAIGGGERRKRDAN